MLETLAWWLGLSLIGWAIAPPVARIAAGLADRGLALSRPLGLILWAYPLWLSGLLGPDAPKALAWPWLLVLIALGWAPAAPRREFLDWLRRHWRKAFALEILAALVFAGAALLRAHSPEAVGTEKPMELAFLQAIYRSPQTPNPDPWYAGAGISYYHFGYFQAALLAHLVRVGPAVAFNLALAQAFALSAGSIAGAVANLLASAGRRAQVALGAGGLAALGTLGLGTLMGLFEALHAQRAVPPSFFQGLGLERLVSPYPGAPSLLPAEAVDHWWWWRAARVFADYLPGARKPAEVIAEFPFFSLLLGDLHPHVLSLATWGMLLGLAVWQFASPHRSLRRLGLLALALGGAAFTNLWDLPTAAALLVGATWLGEGARGSLRPVKAARDALLLGLGAVALYAPFYAALHSATRGIGLAPVRSHPGQFLTHWGLWLGLLVLVLVGLVWRGRACLRGWWGRRGALALGVLGCGALLGAVPLALVAVGVLALGAFLATAPARPAPSEESGTPGRRSARGSRRQCAAPVAANEPARGSGFRLAPTHLALLWVGLGATLLLGAEFFYVRDVFEGSSPRLNTVFKLHYQAWLLIGPATVYLGADLASTLGRAGRSALLGLAGVIAALALLYPAAGVVSRWAPNPTLDAAAFLDRVAPDEARAARWLQSNAEPDAVLVEAVGGSYSPEGHARLSTFSGVPTVLGWSGHEQQWRGDRAGGPAISQRMSDVAALYKAATRDQAMAIAARYRVTYVAAGPREKKTYPEARFDRFAQWWPVAFRSGDLVIYRVADTALSNASSGPGRE